MSMDPVGAMNWVKTHYPNLTEQQIMNKLEGEFGKPGDVNDQTTKPVVTEQKLEQLFGTQQSSGNTTATQPSGFLFDSATDENTLVDIDADFDLDDSEELPVSANSANETASTENETDKEANKEKAIKALADLADISETDAKNILSSLNLDKDGEKVDPSVVAQKLANAAEIEVDDAVSFLKKYVGEPQK